MRHLPVLFLVTFLLISCKSDDDIVTPNQQKLLSKIFQDNDNYSTFEYENGKLSKYEVYSNGVLYTSITLSYDGNEQPQSELNINQTQEVLKKYFYKGAVLDSTEYLSKDTSGTFKVFGYLKYYYNQSNKLDRKVQYTTNNSVIMTIEYFYEANGNVSERRIYITNRLDAILTSTFDNQTNPLYYLKNWLNYDLTMNHNNILSTKAVFVNNSFRNREATYTYTYDSDGYPISSIANIMTSLDTSTINEVYEYK